MILVCHGMGSVPEDFTDEASCQALADQEKVAILGVSGSSCEGKNRFVWKEKFEEDWQHLQMVLGEFTKEVTPAKGKCLAMGFPKEPSFPWN